MMAATQVSDMREPKTAASDENKAPSNTNETGEIIPSNQKEQAQSTQVSTSSASEGSGYHREVLIYEGQLNGQHGPLWFQRFGVLTYTDDEEHLSDLEACGQQGMYKSTLFRSFMSIDRSDENKDLVFGDKRCEIFNHRGSTEYQSYIKEIVRRIEPMVASLVNLEHQVPHLVYRLGTEGGVRVDGDLANETQVKDKLPRESGGWKANETVGH